MEEAADLKSVCYGFDSRHPHHRTCRADSNSGIGARLISE